MVQIHARLRMWGNSVGIVIPQKAIVQENAKVGDNVTVILKNENVLKEMFGTFKFKEPVEKMMQDIDKELYD